MDAKRLGTTRNTAPRRVQRCTQSCLLSATCRHWHERSLLRFSEPCTPEVLRDRRFVLEVERRREDAAAIYAFDLIGAANDVALTELLLDSGKKCQADSRALIEEANKAERPGPLNGSPRQSVAKNRSRSDGQRSMRLTERKRLLIDFRRAPHHGAISASPPAHISLTQTAAKENTYDIARHP